MKQQFVQIEKRSSLEREECVKYMNGLGEKVFENMLSEPIMFHELSQYVDKSFLTPKDAPVPECLDCGACCASAFVVEVKRSDSTPSKYFWEVKIKGKNREILVDRVMRFESDAGRCTALDGEIGKSISCRIYEDRPKDCHLFEAGSDKCHALRRGYGFEPALSENESFRATIHLAEQPYTSESKDKIRHVMITETDVPDMCQIKVVTLEGTETVLHKYNALEESWLESDFNTLSIEQALELILNRQ